MCDLYEAFGGWVVPSLLRTAAGRVTALQTFPNQIFSADFPGKFLSGENCIFLASNTARFVMGT